ncbi:hypothetical protein X971_1586 [Agrobacterium tumefaciens LBA4213 (Ach5)]|nr:hypothetical protein X971_1586 [Agrobacterium tumefaciens LBA4213 (Ach5)]
MGPNVSVSVRVAVINLAFLLVFLRQNGTSPALRAPIYRIIALAMKALRGMPGRYFPWDRAILALILPG